MLRKYGAVATLALLGMSQSALAAQHTVLIMGDGYFPETTYAQPGDTVRFVNMTEVTHTAVANDQSWTTGPLGEEQEFILAANAGLKGAFKNADNASFIGAIRFGTAPTN